MSYTTVWKIEKAWNVMYQVKISHRHSPLASQPSLSFSLVWHIPKVQTLEQFHRWTWNVVMSIFNAFIYNTTHLFPILHYIIATIYSILYWGRVLFHNTFHSPPLLIWHQMSRRRNTESAWEYISTHSSEKNLAHLFKVQGFALYPRDLGRGSPSPCTNPCACPEAHVSSPIHNDQTVREAKQVHKNAS